MQQVRRTYTRITPCKRSAARGKAHRRYPNSEGVQHTGYRLAGQQPTLAGIYANAAPTERIYDSACLPRAALARGYPRFTPTAFLSEL
jgi:hypothetical protein